MKERSYTVDPEDPRAPSQAVWDALPDAARRRILDELPSEIPRATPPEGDAHFNNKVRAREALREWFHRKGRSVYLASELPVYYPDEPMFAPDLIAVLDVSTHERPHWVVSEERRGLDFVLEIHVRGDLRKDREVNVERLARLGVPEYFLYEPLRGRLTGFRLPPARSGTYEPILPQGGRWASAVLDLDLAIEGGHLRFFTGTAPLLDARELIDRLSSMVDDAVRRGEDDARRAQEEARRAERLAAKLRELGVDPDGLD